MKKTFKIMGIISLLFFSFFYVNQINRVLLTQNDLMKIIKYKQDDYYIKAINAKIEGNYIIPGLNGKKVNVLESYYNMRDFKKFNEYYLVYQDVIPQVNLENNKNKIIISGNPNNRNISLIVDNNIIQKYLIEQKIKANILILYYEYNKNSFLEQINNDVDNFNRLNHYLKTKICLVNEEIVNLCLKHNYHLIEVKDYVNQNNIIKMKNNIHSGQILFISHNLSLKNFKILLKEINFKDYNLVYISELISET